MSDRLSREEQALFAPINRTQISDREKRTLISNLQKLLENGVSKVDIQTIIRRILDDEKFKELFAHDYITAVEKIGINPVPSP